MFCLLSKSREARHIATHNPRCDGCVLHWGASLTQGVLASWARTESPDSKALWLCDIEKKHGIINLIPKTYILRNIINLNYRQQQQQLLDRQQEFTLWWKTRTVPSFAQVKSERESNLYIAWRLYSILAFIQTLLIIQEKSPLYIATTTTTTTRSSKEKLVRCMWRRKTSTDIYNKTKCG